MKSLVTVAFLIAFAVLAEAASPCKGNCDVTITKGNGGTIYTITVAPQPHLTDNHNLNWKIDNQTGDPLLVRFDSFATQTCGGGVPQNPACPGDLNPKGPECTSTVGPIPPGKQDHILLKNGHPDDQCYKFSVVATNATNPGLHQTLDPELQIDKGRSAPPPIFLFSILLLGIVLIVLAVLRFRRAGPPARS